MLMKLIIKYKNLLTILTNYLSNINIINKEMFINFDLFRFFNIMIRFLRFYFIILINYLIVREFISCIWLIKFLLSISCIIINNRFIFLLIRRLLKFLTLTSSSMIIATFILNKIVSLIIMILIKDSNSNYNH